MTGRTSNEHLALWIAATGLSHGEIARRIAAEAIRQGHRQIAPDATRVRRWIDGERPRPPVPALLAAVLSDVAVQPLTPGDLGLTAAGPALDSIQLPLLTEAAAQTLAGWTQMDLFLDRRDTLKLALGAPLILAAERMLAPPDACTATPRASTPAPPRRWKRSPRSSRKPTPPRAAACTAQRSSPSSPKSPATSRTASRRR